MFSRNNIRSVKFFFKRRDPGHPWRHRPWCSYRRLGCIDVVGRVQITCTISRASLLARVSQFRNFETICHASSPHDAKSDNSNAVKFNWPKKLRLFLFQRLQRKTQTFFFLRLTRLKQKSEDFLQRHIWLKKKLRGFFSATHSTQKKLRGFFSATHSTQKKLRGFFSETHSTQKKLRGILLATYYYCHLFSRENI